MERSQSVELHYNITKQDYIDLNLNYFENNAIVQRSLKITRFSTAAICILGGSALMYWLKLLSPLSVAGYILLAALCFFGTPWYMKRKVVKNVDRILKSANNKQLCGEKTLTLREDAFELVGENEDRTYPYEVVQRTASDDAHYYIFVEDGFSALIIPFSAFQGEAQKKAFYERISANIQDEALKC